MEIIVAIVTGLMVGLMSSTLGLGGGIVIVPALSVYLGFSLQEAVATSLFTILLVVIINVLRFQMQKLIEWPVAGLIAIFAAISSFLAGRIAVYLSQIILLSFFILFLVYLTVKTFMPTQVHANKQSVRSKWYEAAKVGLLSGFISGLTGVGGGSITTPLLLNGGRISSGKVVPISNSIMLFTSLFASFAYMSVKHPNAAGWQIGYIHLDLAGLLFLSAMPTAYFGAKVQKYLSLSMRKKLLGAFLIIIALRMLFRLLQML